MTDDKRSSKTMSDACELADQDKATGSDLISCYSAIADALVVYRDNREALLDILAGALSDLAIQFPIAETEDDLEDICPFTFFSSFNRPGLESYRIHLIARLMDELGIIDSSHDDRPICPPTSLIGVPTVRDSEARFFNHVDALMANETDSLWRLFMSALEYADGEGQGPQSDEVAHFSSAFNAIFSTRLPGRAKITTALFWIRPQTFIPLDDPWTASWISKHLGYPEEGLAKIRTDATRYLDFIADCKTRVRGWVADRDTATLDDHDYARSIVDESIIPYIVQRAWDENHPPLPELDGEKISGILADYKENVVSVRKTNEWKWQAIRCFQDNWDVDALDFADMLDRSISRHGKLLFSSFYYDPAKEISHFAHHDPDITREAFKELFDEGELLIPRIMHFEETTALLFDRYREDFVRSIGRRSSHGNFFAISVYLFSRYPDKYYLFSPSRFREFSKAAGYPGLFKVASPEIVEQYQTMCEKIHDAIVADDELLMLDASLRDEAVDYSDPEHHLLIEEIVASVANVD